jgi:hypothetical protein
VRVAGKRRRVEENFQAAERPPVSTGTKSDTGPPGTRDHPRDARARLPSAATAIERDAIPGGLIELGVKSFAACSTPPTRQPPQPRDTARLVDLAPNTPSPSLPMPLPTALLRWLIGLPTGDWFGD